MNGTSSTVSRKRKILYLASVRIPSEKASSLAILRQCEGFALNGHTVHLLAPKRTVREETIASVYAMQPNFEIFKFRSWPLFQYGKIGVAFLYAYETLRVLWFFVKMKADYDVIYTRDQYRALPFILLGLSKKCFVELHTIHTNYFTRMVARAAKKIIVISVGLKDFYQRATGREDILVEPSGVYLEQFKDLPAPHKLREALGLPLGRTIYGYVGKYTTTGEEKGVGDIIRSFGIAHKKQPEMFLYIVGVEKSEMDDVLLIFAEADIDPASYKVVGLDQGMFARYVAACDVLLMNYPATEHYKNYMSPIKMFAYMATGKPMITSDLPTIREIKNLQGVLYAQPSAISDYAEKLIYAEKNLPALVEDSRNNIAEAEKYSWDMRGLRILAC